MLELSAVVTPRPITERRNKTFDQCSSRARQGYRVAPGILWTRIFLPFRLIHVNVYLIDDGPFSILQIPFAKVRVSGVQLHVFKCK
jgi:hypothetical protein